MPHLPTSTQCKISTHSLLDVDGLGFAGTLSINPAVTLFLQCTKHVVACEMPKMFPCSSFRKRLSSSTSYQILPSELLMKPRLRNITQTHPNPSRPTKGQYGAHLGIHADTHNLVVPHHRRIFLLGIAESHCRSECRVHPGRKHENGMPRSLQILDQYLTGMNSLMRPLSTSLAKHQLLPAFCWLFWALRTSRPLP